MAKFSGMFLVLTSLFLTDCCGFVQDQSYETSTEERNSGNTKTVSKGFTGKYEIEGEAGSYTGTLSITRVQKNVYTLKWNYDDVDEVMYGQGVELDDYLGFGNVGEGGVIGIFKKQGIELSGLWAPIEGDLVMAEGTEDAIRIRPATEDISGLYYGKDRSTDPATDFTLRLEENGNTWVVSRESDGFITVGIGLAVDNVLITGFAIGGSKIISIYEIDEDGLDGKWAYSYYDEDADEEVYVSGAEKAAKQE